MTAFLLFGFTTRKSEKVNKFYNNFLMLVTEYEDIFIKVKEWGTFESSDIERNGIQICGDDGTPVPDFVTEFERELDIKPGLAPDVCCFLYYYPFDAD